LNVLTRNIDIDPFCLTIEEKIFSGAKRGCTIFAIAALTLVAFDFVNIRSIDNAVALIRDNQTRFADLPDRIREAIDSISIMPLSPSASAAIPRDPVVVAAPVKSQARVQARVSPVDSIDAARNRDAIEFAMEAPRAAAISKYDFVNSHDPLKALASEPIKLASAGTDPMQTIDPTPISLPMSSAIPLEMVPLPRPAPGVPPPSPAERLHLEGKERVKAERCLANAIYFEARSEPVRGQMAVAQVVLNRAFSGFYPDNICGVVYQNAGRHLACQFTFACDGKSKAINERGAWARANRIAKQTLDGQIYVPEVAKSTHYHAIYVHPNWVHEMKKMVRYGIHNFYRPYAWGNGADEPAWGSGVASAKKN
jgi:hypothetical protein